MKKLFYILSVAAAAALVSCQEKELLPRDASPAEVANCYGVYFPAQEASGDHVFSPVDDTVIEITVARTNDKGDITVPVKATYSEEGIFVPEEIVFADGQKETTIQVRFDNAKEGVNYKASFVIEDAQYASIYNSNPVALDFSIMRVEMVYFLDPKTKQPAKVTFAQGSWNEVHTGYIKYYELDGVRHCVTEQEELVGEGSTKGGFWGQDPEVHLEFDWYLGGKESCSCDEGSHSSAIPEGVDGVPAGAQMIRVHPRGIVDYGGDYKFYPYDYFSYYQDKNAYARGFLHFINANELYTNVSYYDGNGGFFFWIYGYTSAAAGWVGDWAQDYDIVGVASGFTRTDYSFSVETDYSSNGQTPIYMEAGVDVASVKYAVYEGELTATQVANKVAAIADGSDASTVFSAFETEEGKKYATLQLAPETTGIYTFVAVAYDGESKPKDQNSGSVVFKHVASEDVEKYTVDMYAFTEDTPERYKNYHKYDSFAIGVVGTDLTDVHLGIFTEADLKKYGSTTILETVKVDSEGDYTLNEASLAMVNGDGGLYDVLSGVKASTTYFVIAWGTNGSMETYSIATYTTEAVPYNWKSLGKGTLTDGLLMPDWQIPDVTVACDLYEEESTPGLFMVTGFQLALASVFYNVDEEVLLPYEGETGNWWNAQIVIDATNPDNVSIAAQDYGIYSNGEYLYALIQAENGTYDGSKITFPASKMYIGYTGNGKWYYGNPEGTFCITFPNAQEAPALTPASTGSVKSEPLHANSKVFEKPEMTFERNPKPVTVAASTSSVRKEKKTGNKDFGPFETIQ